MHCLSAWLPSVPVSVPVSISLPMPLSVALCPWLSVRVYNSVSLLQRATYLHVGPQTSAVQAGRQAGCIVQ
jgi:hypothetical protein